MTWIIGGWVLCGMLASGVYAYRDGGKRDPYGQEPFAIVFAAPLALAYQIGALLRERRG